MASEQTPSQTIGPFFAYGLTPTQYGYPLASVCSPDLTTDETPGERVRIQGHVLDRDGEPMSDALVEIWQADAEGRYSHPADPRGSNASFGGFGRAGTGTDPDSRYWFDTIKPGSVDGAQAPHVNVIVFARGLPNHVFTRIYFADEETANEADPVLAAVPPNRRHTLLAMRDPAALTRGTVYRFDIRMQGDDETVFFDV